MNTSDEHKNELSRAKLDRVHVKLQSLFHALSLNSTMTFIITEGLRTKERQRELVDAGASRTLVSKHLVGRAVDVAILVGDEVRWDWPLYRQFAEQVKATAARLGIGIRWGGDWKNFKDGPHFELKNEEK